MVVPSVADAITSELTGIVTGAEVDVAGSALHTVDALGNDDSICLQDGAEENQKGM